MQTTTSSRTISARLGVLSTLLAVLLAPSGVLLAQQKSADITVEWMQRHTDGEVGVYLRRVEGPVLGAYNEHNVFEPASAIKVLHLLHTLLQVDAGTVRLHDPLVVFEESDGSCPVNMPPVRLEGTRQALRLMMERSSNSRTHAIQTRFGATALNTTGATIGMQNTQVRHRLGCRRMAGQNPNRATLADFATLYEQALSGTLLTPASRALFEDLMVQNTGLVAAVVNGEAALLGVPVSVREAFKSDMRVVYKAGSYGYGGRLYRSLAGWISLPIAGGAETREYVFGVYVHRATTLTNGEPETLTTAAATRLLLHDAIRHALENY